MMESGVWWRALVAAWCSAEATGVPSPSANCHLIARLLAHRWQKEWQAPLYPLSNVHSTLVPFYLESKLLGARSFLHCVCQVLGMGGSGLRREVFTPCRDAQASSTWAPAAGRGCPATAAWCCACNAAKAPGSRGSLRSSVLHHTSPATLLRDPHQWSCTARSYAGSGSLVQWLIMQERLALNLRGSTVTLLISAALQSLLSNSALQHVGTGGSFCQTHPNHPTSSACFGPGSTLRQILLNSY